MPASLVTAVSAPICAGLVAVTVTPGSTPPCASLTSPLILPVELAPPPWANAGPAASSTVAARAQMILLQRFMQEPPGDPTHREKTVRVSPQVPIGLSQDKRAVAEPSAGIGPQPTVRLFSKANARRA